ncbi:hypothetical protein [Treponema phagedenis]|nr:hypothetical protein [Treponema phagedenis]
MKRLLFYFKKYGGFKYLANLIAERLLLYSICLFIILPKNRIGLKTLEE